MHSFIQVKHYKSMEYKTPAVAEMGDCLAIIDMGRKEGEQKKSMLLYVV